MPDTAPPDPSDHAEDFAHRWTDELDRLVAERMEQLGIPPERIGSSDHKHGIAWCAFNPHEGEGGGVSPGGRINVDSGVLNPDLMDDYGEEASGRWAKARLRDRIDASIAHEYEEAKDGSHEGAVERAPDTELPVGDRVRSLLRSIAEGNRSR